MTSRRRPAGRGRGFAPRAVRLLTGWAFGDLGLTRLLIEANEENIASVRVAEKSGFERIGSRTEPDARGEPRHTVVFALEA